MQNLIINCMTDKFEFKKLQTIDLFHEPRAQFKRKPSLLEYKQVILELSNALNSVSQQNQALSSQLKSQTQNNKQLTLKLQTQIKRNQQYQNAKLNYDSQLKKLQTQLDQYRTKIIQSQQKLKSLQYKNQLLQQTILQLRQNKDKLQRNSMINIQKIKVLEENLHLLIQQGRNAKIEVHQAYRNKQQQLKQIKQFRDQVKMKFQLLYHDKPVNFGYDNDSRFQQKLNDIKQRRSFSTQKKTRRNIGHLSNTQRLQKPSTKPKNFAQNHRLYQYIKPFQHSSMNNPQLGQQLQNLKKQIGQQYTLINLKTQTYNKQRVSKTLQQLKRKMGKVIQAVQRSESQSAIDN